MSDDFDTHHRRLGLLLVHDGKPGHRTQAEGLGTAMALLRNAMAYEWNAESLEPLPEMEDPPKLIVSVGRHAATPALRLAKAFKARSVALMNPGYFARRKFDLCVIPKHDGIQAHERILLTDGVINAIPVCSDARLNQGLILVGGPSKHHDWDAPAIIGQIEFILKETLKQSADTAFTATSSRRTPKETEDALTALAARSDGRLTFIPAKDTPRGWVAAQLHKRGTVWVSADSVSMLYEALSAGAAVGLLEVPEKKRWFGQSRVVRGVHDLLGRGLATPYAEFQKGLPLERKTPLREADRVAEEILKRWPEL